MHIINKPCRNINKILIEVETLRVINVKALVIFLFFFFFMSSLTEENVNEYKQLLFFFFIT